MILSMKLLEIIISLVYASDLLLVDNIDEITFFKCE